MKIAHIGDAHWGLGYPGPNPKARFDDITDVMDWAADKMIEEKVDLCLFAGDAFKDSRVMLDRARVEIDAFYSWINRLCGAGIPLVIISGTPSHDAIDAYKLLRGMVDKDRVSILTEPELLELQRPRVNVACVPGLNRSALLTREEFHGKSAQEIHRLMTEKITDIARGLLAKGAETGLPTILLSHMTYSEADTGFDHLLLEHEPLLTPAAVEGYDLVCLGHIHRAQNVGGRVFYCGAPERHSFNDEHVTPGFWIYDLPKDSEDWDSATATLVETPAREFTTLVYGDFGVDGDKLLDALADRIHMWKRDEDEHGVYSISEAIVRLSVKATEEQAKSINCKDIEELLYDAGVFFVQEVKIDTVHTDRIRDETVTESLAPIEALAKWSEQQGISEDEIHELISMAGELLAEGVA
jgi:exonuclease SbcD